MQTSFLVGNRIFASPCKAPKHKTYDEEQLLVNPCKYQISVYNLHTNEYSSSNFDTIVCETCSGAFMSRFVCTRNRYWQVLAIATEHQDLVFLIINNITVSLSVEANVPWIYKLVWTIAK